MKPHFDADLMEIAKGAMSLQGNFDSIETTVKGAETNLTLIDDTFRTVASHLQGFHKAIQAVGHRLRVVESAMRHMSESLAAAEKQSKVRGAAAPKPRRSLGGSRREKRAGAASNLRAL